jgi:hypothetical protein
MAKTPAVPPTAEADAAEQSARRLATTICRHVITALGRPTDFLRITARQVTGDGFRVNVITGPDASCTRIAHSFFITADGEGNIMGSTPPIKKLH